MSHGEPRPPRSAIWLLRHMRPGKHNQALTGDLVERFQEGRSQGWFWKQVLIAIAVGVLSEIRRRWPQFCYAIAGLAMPVFLGRIVRRIPLPWHALPWPWSQLVMELGYTAILALAALPALAVALLINREFRWVSLPRTAAINLVLIALGHYSVDVFPWLFRPVGTDGHLKALSIPPAFWIPLFFLLFFSNFFVSACLGCLAPRGPNELAGGNACGSATTDPL